MLATIKKYKFYTKKTNFIKFIIKLRQINIVRQYCQVYGREQASQA